jgi:hypothetical protein
MNATQGYWRWGCAIVLDVLLARRKRNFRYDLSNLRDLRHEVSNRDDYRTGTLNGCLHSTTAVLTYWCKFPHMETTQRHNFPAEKIR